MAKKGLRIIRHAYLLMMVVVRAQVHFHLCCSLVLLVAGLHREYSPSIHSQLLANECEEQHAVQHTALQNLCSSSNILVATRRLRQLYLAEKVALGDADILVDALLLGDGHLRSGHTREFPVMRCHQGLGAQGTRLSAAEWSITQLERQYLCLKECIKLSKGKEM